MIYDISYDISYNVSYQLVYEPNYDCSNILLIDNRVEDYQDIVNSVNSNTLAIVYSYSSTKEDLSNVLSNFNTIERIGFAFLFNPNSNTFLDNEPFFSTDSSSNIDPQSENLLFLIELFTRYNVKNVDYLACDTLKYESWNNYYNSLISNTTTIIGASDNKTGNIKYGGDWILESTGQDIESIYFTKNIEYYTYLLDVAVWANLSGAAGITSYNYNIYAGSFYVSYITQFPINSNRTAGTSISWYTYSSVLYSVTYHNGFIYTSLIPNSTGPIIQIPVNANGTAGTANTSWVTNINTPFALLGYNSYLFTAVNTGSSGSIQQIPINANNTAGTMVTWYNQATIGLAINNSFMYATLAASNGIVVIPINANGTAGTPTITVTTNSMYGIAIYNSYLYSNNYTGGAAYIIQIPINTNGSLGTINYTWKASTNDYYLTVAQEPSGIYSLYETHVNNGNISQFDLVQRVGPIFLTGFYYNNIDICNNISSIVKVDNPQYSGANFSTKYFVNVAGTYYDLAQLYYINPSLISTPSILTQMKTLYNGQYYDLNSFLKRQNSLFTSLSVSPSKCNGCFSILLLNADYTGFILKIRRTDGTLMSFYSSDNGVLTNGSGTTIATFLSGSTGYVDTWYDQSGKGNHATQTTTASQPIFDVTNNCIDFGYSTSSNLFMNMPSGTVPVGIFDASYSFVVRHGNARNISNGGFIGSGTSATNQCNSFRFNGGIHYYWNYWYSNDFGWNDTNTDIPISSSVTYNGITKIQKGYVSNTLQSTIPDRTGVTNAVALQTIGQTVVGEYLQGQMYSLLIYSAELLQSDINTINSYLSPSYVVGSGLTLASINTTGRSLYYGTSSNGTTMNNSLSTTLVINRATRVKILMIGGGGCGGNGLTSNNGGGQGGNGVYADITLNPGTYNITMDTGTAENTIYGRGGSSVTFALSGSSAYTITATGGSGGQTNHQPGYSTNPSNGLTSPTTTLSQSNVNSYYYARGSNGQSANSFSQSGYVIVPETATISGITKATNAWYYPTGYQMGQTGNYVNYSNYFGITHQVVQDNYYYLPIDANMFNDISSNTKTYKTYFQIGFGSGGQDDFGYPGYSDTNGYVYRGGAAGPYNSSLTVPYKYQAYQAAGTSLYSIGCGGCGTAYASSTTPTTGYFGGPAAIYLYF